MATCVAQQSSRRLPSISDPRKYLHGITYDSRIKPTFCRKRLLSEPNDRYISFVKYPDDRTEIKKKTKRDLFSHDSTNQHQFDGMKCSTLSFFESTRHCHSTTGLLRRRSLTHSSSFTCIKDAAFAQTIISFLPTSSTTTTTTNENNMLVCQQTPALILNNQTEKDNGLCFITSWQLNAYMNNTNQTMLIIDCGSPLRHTERRIEHSLLLNVNDKISRKRLSSRGLKNFLDSTQLNRFNENELIVLYDDTTHTFPCAHPSGQPQLSQSMKCIYDEIKRYDNNKTIYILQSSFDEFYQHCPSCCYISKSTDEDLSLPSPTPMKQLDLESCPLSKILPGLYLGSSRDAEDFNSLKEHQIETVINISTSIPCYFENENLFDYQRLPCHDSSHQNILQYFETTFEYIHQKLSNNKTILIHCQAGISRSPSFVIGYLMKYHSKTFDEAYQFVRNKRNIISPNLHFLGQLIQYQQMLTSA